MAIQVSIVGLNIAKSVFQVHGVGGYGRAVLRKRLRRVQASAFFERLAPCLIGMEATRALTTGRECWPLLGTTCG